MLLTAIDKARTDPQICNHRLPLNKTRKMKDTEIDIVTTFGTLNETVATCLVPDSLKTQWNITSHTCKG